MMLPTSTPVRLASRLLLPDANWQSGMAKWGDFAGFAEDSVTVWSKLNSVVVGPRLNEQCGLGRGFRPRTTEEDCRGDWSDRRRFPRP